MFDLEKKMTLIVFQWRHLTFVESPRIELGSKQATKKLSTRLFPD